MEAYSFVMTPYNSCANSKRTMLPKRIWTLKENEIPFPPRPQYTLDIVLKKIKCFNDRLSKLNEYSSTQLQNSSIKFELFSMIDSSKNYYDDMEKMESKNFEIKVKIISTCFNASNLLDRIFKTQRVDFWLSNQELEELKKIWSQIH